MENIYSLYETKTKYSFVNVILSIAVIVTLIIKGHTQSMDGNSIVEHNR